MLMWEVSWATILKLAVLLRLENILKIEGKDTNQLTHLEEGCMWWCLLMSRVTGDLGGLIMGFFTETSRDLQGQQL